MDDTNKQSSGYTNKSTFSIGTFNILAESYTPFFSKADEDCKYLETTHRKKNLIQQITNLKPDIWCLQEVDEYAIYWKNKLQALGYESIHLKRTTVRKDDGCAIAYNPQKFTLQKQYHVKFNELEKELLYNPDVVDLVRFRTNNVGIIAVFNVLNTSLKILVASAHLYWDPEHNDVKFYQAKKLLSEITKILDKDYNAQDIPIIIGGDFNSIPSSAVYQLLSTGFVNNSHEDFGFKKKYNTLLDFIPKGTTTRGIMFKEVEKKDDIEKHHELELVNIYSGEYQTPTTYTRDFVDVLDYLWISKDKFVIENVCKLPLVDEIELEGEVPFLPSNKHGSDHLPLCATVTLI